MTDLVLVSYLNTLPFLNGIETANGLSMFNIIKKMPADCAKLFISGEADIALLPVGTIPFLPKHNVITDYCIGCDGTVRTVVVMSHSPLDKVKKIYLDMDSRSSSLLSKIILKDFRKLEIEFVNGMPAFPVSIGMDEAVLMIGDKVFEYEAVFKHKLDLGDEWKLHTGLPFAFAVWVARDTVSSDVCVTLNNLLANGIDSINHHHFKSDKGINLDTYFQHNISYKFDDLKKKALGIYLELGKKYLGEQ